MKQIFWKTKTFFKKLEYRLLVENTKIENALFPYKFVMSEANVKTNRMVSTKWTHSLSSSNIFVFLPLQRHFYKSILLLLFFVSVFNKGGSLSLHSYYRLMWNEIQCYTQNGFIE